LRLVSTTKRVVAVAEPRFAAYHASVRYQVEKSFGSAGKYWLAHQS
jgi:hypothetical protein